MTDRIDGVLFDLDGTLVDSGPLIVRCFNAALQGRGRPTLQHRRIQAMLGMPLRDMFSSIVNGDESSLIEELVQSYKDAFQRLGAGQFRSFPGAEKLLQQLAKHTPLAIVTTRTAASAARILSSLGIEGYFQVLVGLEDVRRPKPHPEPLQLALSQLKVPAERAVMVGDTVQDMLAGKQAGTTTIGITSGPHSAEQLRIAGAQQVVGSIAELEGILFPE